MYFAVTVKPAGGVFEAFADAVEVARASAAEIPTLKAFEAWSEAEAWVVSQGCSMDGLQRQQEEGPAPEPSQQPEARTADEGTPVPQDCDCLVCIAVSVPVSGGGAR